MLLLNYRTSCSTGYPLTYPHGWLIHSLLRPSCPHRSPSHSPSRNWIAVMGRRSIALISHSLTEYHCILRQRLIHIHQTSINRACLVTQQQQRWQLQRPLRQHNGWDHGFQDYLATI